MSEAGAVRQGEELPVAAVDAWLRERLPGLSGPPRVTQFRGGASNWTYRLEYPGHDLVLRRPPAGTKAKSAHDMAREFRVQEALGPHFPLVPEMVAHCADEAVIGAEFYVMRRIDGVVPQARGFAPSPAQARKLCENTIDALAALHRVDPRPAGLATLGRGPGYPRRQVEGWSDRYLQARTFNVPSFARVRAWLAEHTPDDVATAVIHNDFRLDNLVLDRDDPARIVGVLDWEMATLGDPLMDLGNSLAYWVQADDDFFFRATRRQPTHLPGMLTREEVVARYLERTGLAPPSFLFYEVFGLFRLAAIAQQIYYRYVRRQTRNRAFRFFFVYVHALDRRCQRLLRRAGRATARASSGGTR